MALIKSKELRFTPSASPDVVTNKLYITKNGIPLTYDSESYDVGNTIDLDTQKVHVDLRSFLSQKDGIFDLAIAAIDDVGNEADMMVMLAVPLDFVAPDVVSGLELL